MFKRTFLFAAIIILGTILLPEIKTDCRSEIFAARDEIAKVSLPDFGALCVKVEFVNDGIRDHRKLTIKHDTGTTKPKPVSEQTFFKEKRNETIDRSRETAMFPFTAIFLGNLKTPIALVSHLAFVKYSSWAGNITNIRPPPIL